MGLCLEAVRENGPEFRHDVKHSVLWVCIRQEVTGDNVKCFLQGIFEDEMVAKGLCIDENHFIGPIPMNVALPTGNVAWPGAYYPKREAKK